MSVFFIGTLHAKLGQIDNLIKSLDKLKDSEGYISNVVFRDLGDENKLISVEQWAEEQNHSDFFSSIPKDEMAEWLEMQDEEPQGTFYKKL